MVADVNGDGEITTKDSLALNKYLAGASGTSVNLNKVMLITLKK